MRVSPSAWYAWRKKPAANPPEDIAIRIMLKELFSASRESAGSRTLVKKLRGEGVTISRWRVRKIMNEEGLVCRQRRAWKVTTKPKKGADFAPNLFNPPGLNQIWVSDITYCVPGVQGEHGCSNEPRVCLEY